MRNKISIFLCKSLIKIYALCAQTSHHRHHNTTTYEDNFILKIPFKKPRKAGHLKIEVILLTGKGNSKSLDFEISSDRNHAADRAEQYS